MPIKPNKRLEKIEKLIWLQDQEEPTALDEADREAVHIVVRNALDSDAAFMLLLRQRGKLRPNEETDYICGSIRGCLDFFALVLQAAHVIRDVTPPRESGPIRQMMKEHGLQLHVLERADVSLSGQMSALVALINVEVLFFGHFWARFRK